MKKNILLGSAVALIFAVSSSHGFDLHFLKNSPARYFTKQDWDIAKTATRDILENSELGDSVMWDNPDSGNSGKLTILKAGKSSGKLCKKLEITNRAKGQEGTSNSIFCKQPDGKWKTVIKK
ncbi:MAG: RT0821/Lpp0805 family surface protein [Candidatus Thiodiazotropha endolucinida]